MSKEKPVILCNAEGDELVKFKSLTECSKVIGVPVQAIASARKFGHLCRKKFRFL